MSVFNLRTSQKGFTIVELLIVIVVIGILASITVIAYNGVNERAKNASRLSTVEQMREVVEIALLKHDPYDLRATLNGASENWWRACLGTGFANIGETAAGDCAWWGNDPYVSESTAFNTILQETGALPRIPSSYPESISDDGDHVAGPYFGSAWVDSKDMLVVEYTLEGEGTPCELSPLVYKNGGNPSMAPAGGASSEYSALGDGVTECVVAVVQDM